MSPSYQTIPPANVPKDEPSSTLVPMMKKIAIVAMVGTALVVGYSYYGSSTNPARIDIATTTMTTTTAAANLVRGGVSNNGDAGQEDDCHGFLDEKKCEEKGCYWRYTGVCF